MIPVFPVRKALCLLLLLFLASNPGSAQQGAREIMADAMARMMEAMGLFDSAPGRQGLGVAPTDPMSMMGPLGGAGWGSVLGRPWGDPVQDPSRTFAMRELMKQFTRQMTRPGDSGEWPIRWKPSRLEGVWEGRDGELLVVQGSRFRIYSREMPPVDGLMHIQGERLALYNPLDGHAQPFEFAELQGRLVMRDLAARVYLYRRLRLDGGQPRAATPLSPGR